MHSYNNLYSKVYDRDNLELAFDNAVKNKNKRSKRRIIKWCKAHREKVLNKTKSDLMNETYFLRHHTPCTIYDGVSRKKRIIVTPDFNNEEIIHHAVIQVLQPIIIRGMDANSCASIPMRGCYYGKKKVEKFIRKNPKDCKYCLKMDIEQFFPSINHKYLKDLISKKIRDRKFQKLVFGIVDNYENTEGKGVPLGYYTSQWFANWYLQDLDHYIRELLKAKFYIRYMDDMVIFDSNKRKLHKIKLEIEKYLNEKLDLKLNRRWKIFRFDYEYKHANKEVKGGTFLDFMGYRFYRNRTTLRRSTMLNATRKARKLYKGKVTWYSASQMLSYLGKFKGTNTYNIYEKYIKGFINVRRLKQRVSSHQRRLNNENRMELSKKYS